MTSHKVVTDGNELVCFDKSQPCEYTARFTSKYGMEKARKEPYGHTGYSRKTPKGKIAQVPARGVKPEEAETLDGTWEKDRAYETKVGEQRLTIFGIGQDREKAAVMIDRLKSSGLLNGVEAEDRLLIQQAIDEYKLKADILYAGNTVYGFNRVVNDFKHALTSKPSPVTENGSGDWDMSDYLYKFFSLACGSIAHFNKYGWIGTYPTKEDLKGFLHRNEMGQDILSYQPSWATDRQKIAKELLKLSNTI